jgi:2-keto-4-pentenoate hydratase/2-oxohepta-3-ene-1,7-dioic acid hydratase in catechol pathway
MPGLPIERPQKIIAVGMNYRDHAAEAGNEVPEKPVVFAKWPNSLVGPGEPIVIPSWVEEVDYEAELGVVIGQRARGVTPDEALRFVAGYVCVNDVSSRKLQFEDGQWSRAKSIDTFTPVGPRLAPASEISDPQALHIRCLVNGRALQDSSTHEMVFGVAELISFISTGITLEPGDLIATGTPAGVGFTREPPVFLGDGDEVTVEIEGIGALTNPVRKEARDGVRPDSEDDGEGRRGGERRRGIPGLGRGVSR